MMPHLQFVRQTIHPCPELGGAEVQLVQGVAGGHRRLLRHTGAGMSVVRIIILFWSLSYRWETMISWTLSVSIKKETHRIQI